MMDGESSIRDLLMEAGAVAVGVAKCEPVDTDAWTSFLSWLDKGYNADMGYMANHQELRRDPRLLLEGAQSIISLAFPFAQQKYRDSSKGMNACYAYGDDYHDVLRRRLRRAVEKIRDIYGGEYRICIDSAPVMERYWAVKTGIATLGGNGAAIVPRYGSMVFLAEIITTLPFPSLSSISSYPSAGESACGDCKRCVKGCPGSAIGPGGEVDAWKCISYLSIEHRGEWKSAEASAVMNTPVGERTIFGCDLCLRACPLNRCVPPTTIAEFKARPEVMTLSREDVREMSQEEFSRRFKGSPIKRAKLAGLKRNCSCSE